MRTAIPVHRVKLEEALREAEANGPLINPNALWQKIAEIYNQTAEKPISFSVVASRVKEWNLSYVTKKGHRSGKTRSSRPVDQVCLTQSLQTAEENGPLANLNALWRKVAEIYNQANPENPITHSIAMLRVADWKIPYLTQKGKKGRSPGQGPIHTGPKTSRSTKFAKSDDVKKSVEAMEEMLKSNDAERYMKLAKAAGKGSMRAAVKLNCLQCCAFVTNEVRQCGSIACPMWPYRPYQHEKKAA